MSELKHSKISRRSFIKYSAVTGVATYALLSPGHLALKALVPTLDQSSTDTTAQETIVGTVHPPNCGGRCYLNFHVYNGRIVQISPGATPVIPAYQEICLRGLPEMQRIYSPDRLKYPMKQVGQRGSGNWQQITWQEALDTVAGWMQDEISANGPSSVLFAGTVGYLPSLLNASTIFGGIDSGFPMGHDVTLGNAPGNSLSSRNSPEITSLIHSKLIILWHNNMMYTTMTDSRFMFDAMEMGAKLYVVDPRYSVTASKADWWLHPKPGGADTALALGMINLIIQNNLYDTNFLLAKTVSPLLVRRDTKLYLRQSDVTQDGSKTTFMMYDMSTSSAVPAGTSGTTPALTGTYTVGGIVCDTAFSLLAQSVSQYTADKVESITGVPTSDVVKLTVDYATMKPSYLGWGWNDKYTYSEELARAIATLAALTGQIGVPGGGAGVVSHHWASWPVNLGGITLPKGAKTNGIPTLELSTKSNPVRMMYCATNLIQQRLPDFNRTINWVMGLDHVVVADSFMTTSARYADILLPVNLFVESANFPRMGITSGPTARNFVLLTQKVINPVFDTKLDFEIEVELGNRLGFSSFYQGLTPDTIIQAQLKGGSDAFSQQALSGITLNALVANGGIMRTNVPLEGHVPFSKTSPIQTFSTPTGLIEFYNEVLIPFNLALPTYRDDNEASPTSSVASKYPLVLDNAHSKFRTHSTFANTPVLLEINPEPVVEINPADASARGIINGDVAKVYNDRGYVKIKAKVNDSIQPGMLRISEGWWINQFIEGAMNSLTNPVANPAQYVLDARSPNMNYDDTRVEIQKA